MACERIRALTGNDDLHVVHCDHANLDTVRAAAARAAGALRGAARARQQRRPDGDAAPDHRRRARGDLPGQPPQRLPAHGAVARPAGRIGAARASVTVSSIAHRVASPQLRRSAERAPLRRLVRLRPFEARQPPVHVRAGSPPGGLGRDGQRAAPGDRADRIRAQQRRPDGRPDARRAGHAARRLAAQGGANADLALRAPRMSRARAGATSPAAARGARRARSYDRDAQTRLWDAGEALLGASGDAPRSACERRASGPAGGARDYDCAQARAGRRVPSIHRRSNVHVAPCPRRRSRGRARLRGGAISARCAGDSHPAVRRLRQGTEHHAGLRHGLQPRADRSRSTRTRPPSRRPRRSSRPRSACSAPSSCSSRRRRSRPRAGTGRPSS